MPSVVSPGETVHLSCSPVGGTGSYVSFLWEGPGGFTSAEQTPGDTKVSSIGSNVFGVTVLDDAGGSGTASVQVFVVESPLEVAASASPAMLSMGGSTSLACTPAGGTGEYVSFRWLGSDGFQSQLQNPGLVVPAGVAEIRYTVSVTDTSGATASTMISVVVGQRVVSDAVVAARVRYRVTSASDGERPLDQFRVVLQGLTLNEGDRVALSFNGLPVGDLATGDGLRLDARHRASGQLGSSPNVYNKCRIRYVARRRRLVFIASRGVSGAGPRPLVMQASGVSEAVPVAILVDHAPSDGRIDAAGIVSVPMSVKVAEKNGVRVESGSVRKRKR